MNAVRRTSQQRQGAAVVEFAVCLPVIIILVLGAIECTTMIFVNQSLNVVAYEGVRASIRPESTTTEVLARCDNVIAERNLVGAQVTINPTSVENASRGQQVTVTVAAPAQENGALALRFFSGSLTAQAVMFKE